MPPQPPVKTPIERFEILLRRLHALDEIGQGESNEAECIRDEMELPWRTMTKEDQEKMRKLSEQLHLES